MHPPADGIVASDREGASFGADPSVQNESVTPESVVPGEERFDR
jgi:hypothetical protein